MSSNPVQVSDLWRLAEQAERNGVRIFVEHLSGEHFATSGSRPSVVYRVTGFSCTCAGFVHHQRCQHHAALLATLGWLPDPDDDPDPPAPTATTTEVPIIVCLTCRGRGCEDGDAGAGSGSGSSCPACGGTSGVSGVPAARADVASGSRDEDAVRDHVAAEVRLAPWEEASGSAGHSGADTDSAVPVVARPVPLTLVPRAERAQALATTIDTAVERLAEQLSAGMTAEYLRTLRFFSRFHQYSARNVLLILAQRPDASLVAGLRRWGELGYRVRKGERAIWVTAPITRTEVDAATGREVKVVTGFTPVPVFDCGQLAGLDEKPIPTLDRRLPDDAEPLFQAVKRRVEAQGIRVEERGLPAGVEGVSTGGLILLKPGLDSRSRLLTLLHEVCHEVAHAGETQQAKPRQVLELEAESVAYVVGGILGVESPFSSGYLAGYGVTAEVLKGSLGTIQRLVREVLAILGETEQADRVALAA